MRIAVADLGGHTFHMLCARVGPDGTLVPELTRRHPLRLAASVVDGRIPRDAWTQALAAIDDLATTAEMYGFQLFAIGTSVLRDTEDGRALARAAGDILGVPVQLLSGREEAELVFLGARSALPPPTGPVAVIDLGGGSLEVALGDGRAIAATFSLPLGALRLRSLGADALAERVRTDGADTWRAIRAYEPETIVLTGGSARLVARLLGTPNIDSARLGSLARQLAVLDDEGRLALGVPAARLDTIGAATSILAAILAACGGGRGEVSPRGLREGFVVRASRR